MHVDMYIRVTRDNTIERRNVRDRCLGISAPLSRPSRSQFSPVRRKIDNRYRVNNAVMFPGKEYLLVRSHWQSENSFFSFSHRKQVSLGNSPGKTAHIVARCRIASWKPIFSHERGCPRCIVRGNNLSIIFPLCTVANLRNAGHIERARTARHRGHGHHFERWCILQACNLHPRKGKAVEKTQTTTTTHVSFPLAEPSSPIRYHTTHGLRTPCRSLPGFYRVSRTDGPLYLSNSLVHA